jgi:hypothetical protein
MGASRKGAALAAATIAAVAVGGASALAAAASRTATTPVVSSHGVGGVRFGTSESEAVKELTSLLGSPTRRFASNGCGPKYTEVEWGHLYVEFRLGKLTGFRYLSGAWEGPTVPLGARDHGLVPKLTTSEGVSLGDTLAQVRDRYGALEIVGTDRWRTRDGLVFYVSYLVTQPAPSNSRITEIKYGTCGDW